MRTGPGTTYPVEWVFVRRGLPVEVIAEFDVLAAGSATGRGRSAGCTRACWTAGARRRITGAERDLRSEPAEAGSIVVRLAPGVIGRLLECETSWCQIEAEGYRGWLKRDEFWGTYPDEKVRIAQIEMPAGSLVEIVGERGAHRFRA